MISTVNSEFRELIGDLYNKGVFSKLEEDYLLRGIFSKELVKNFLANGKTEFTMCNIKHKFMKGYEVQQIIDLMAKYEYTESILTIDRDYLKHWNHNVFKSGGVLKRMEIKKYWDSDFGAFYLEIEVDIDFYNHTVEVASFLDFVKAFGEHESKLIPGTTCSFGYLLDPWSGANPLLSKLNLTSALREFLKDRKVKKLEVEVIDEREAYVFYQFYPKLTHRNY